MMGLLTLIPGPYRILAMILAAVALFGFGFLKGAQWEQGKQAVAQSDAYAEMIVKIQKQIKEDKASAAKFAKERDEERKKSRKLRGELDALLNAPKYESKECEIDAPVFDKLNEVLK